MKKRRFISLTGRVPAATNGQGMLEVALILALVVIVLLISLTIVGLNLRLEYCRVIGELQGGGMCQHYCSDNFANLSGWTSSGSGWQANNGMMCNSSTSEQRTYNTCSSNNIPNDYSVRLEVAQLYQGMGYGIFFRVQSQNPLNAYTFQYDPGLNAFVFRKWVNGSELPPFASAPVPVSYNWYNQARQIQVVIHGNSFQAYVDRALVLEATDSTFPSGSAGLRTWDSSQACFGNFTIDPN